MSTFHPFPKLPTELRLLIWEMTVEPREVEVRLTTPEDPIEAERIHPSDWNMGARGKWSKATQGMPNSTPADHEAIEKVWEEWKNWHPRVHLVSSNIPGTMHTCRESRNNGLYQKVSLDNQHGTDRRYVWLNPDIDLVNIGEMYLAYLEPIAHLFKRLKLERELSDYWWESENELLGNFINVEEMHVVVTDGFYAWGEEEYRFPWPCPLENLFFIDETLPGRRMVAGPDEMDRIALKMQEAGDCAKWDSID
jgi:hypothetical protein